MLKKLGDFWRSKDMLSRYLILTVSSIILFFISALLHNFIYAIFIAIFGEDIWSRTGLEDEAVFFLIAVFVCPTLFLIGLIGSIWSAIKKVTGREE